MRGKNRVLSRFMSIILIMSFVMSSMMTSKMPAYAFTPIPSLDPSGNILFQDDFEDGDYDGWMVTSNWSLVDDGGSKVLRVSNANEGFLLAGDDAWTDYSYEAKFKTKPGAFSGLLGRAADTSNYYYLQPQPGNGAIVLSKRVNGQDTTIKTEPLDIPVDEWFCLKVTFEGNRITGYLNGEKVISATDNTFKSGKIGARTRWGGGESIDDVIVTDERILYDNFEDKNLDGWVVEQGDFTVTEDVYSTVTEVVYVLQTGLDSEGFISSGVSDWDNYWLKAKYMALEEGDHFAMVVRSFDANNNYSFKINPLRDVLELTKKVNGVETVLDSVDYSIMPETWYTISVEVAGGEISAYIDGTLVMRANDNTYATGKIGFSYEACSSYIDEVQVGTMVDTNLVDVLLDGNDIKADNVNGLTFKGFGVLSANSTSALLMDYKSEHPEKYTELLQILFGGENPIMNQVKIEMGNDRNTSTGPDPATMRTADEEANVKRHPGFQLAADAKKINPDLKVSILRWCAPAWADNNDKVYTWYKNTILTAYRQYGYMVDYVNPGINEHAADLAWTKEYAKRVREDSEGFESEKEKSLYNSIELVISDEVGIGSFGGNMVNDPALRDAVSVAGFHYNTDDDGGGNFKRLADEFDIEVWNSEAQATFSNTSFRPNNNVKDPSVAGTGIGGVGSALEMGNTIIKGFVNSRRTHFIYQPAIGSFYEGGQYSFKELVSARDPWSGWIHYDGGLAILQHFSWFVNAGWENESNTAGIWRAVPKASSTGATGTNPVNGRNGTPSYMTIAAPDKSDFSTIFVNDSEYWKTYKLETVNMGYAGNPSLEVWETRAADKGEAFNSNYMKFQGNISADDAGVYTVRVKPYSIVTVTTLNNQGKEAFNTPLPVEGERTVLDTDTTGSIQDTQDNILYADDFDYSDKKVPVIGEGGQIVGTESYIESRGGKKGTIPRYTHDRNGAFEAYLDENTGNYVLRQQVDREIMGLGSTWNGGDPVTAIGDYRWTNYKASVDVSFENNDTYGGANYVGIGARYQGGGSSHTISGTPYVLKYWFDGGWQLLVNNRVVADGNVLTGDGGVKIDGFNATYDAWHNIAIQVAGDTVTAYLDGEELASYTDPNPKLSGRVDLASGYYHVRFDNLKVETVDGYVPYYSEQLDDLEMHDLASVPNPKLIYGGSWIHQNGQGMYVYQRSISTSQGKGATLKYTFVGTGLDILGKNDGSAKLEVTVDGQVIALSDSAMGSGELYQTYTLRGLKYGQHTVQIKVLDGTLNVDTVAVVSDKVKGVANTSALQETLQEAQGIERLDEFREVDWQLFTTSLNAVEEALEDPVSYKLDQEGADHLQKRLIFAKNQLITGDMKELDSPHYAATYVGGVPNLPNQVEATGEDGSKTFVPVKWNLDDVRFDTPYKTVTVIGTYGSLTAVGYVEVVPKDIFYFTDINGTVGSLGYDSPAYSAVANLAAANGKPLLNNAPDQVYNSNNGWGHGGFNASGSPKISYKGIESGPYSKQSTTGMYTDNQNGATLTYTFEDVPAGEHTLTLGTYSWWASYARTEEVYLEYDNKSEKVDTITLDSNSFDVVKGYNFSMPEAGTVILKLKAVQQSQSPMLSFVGVAPAQKVDKSALQAIYDEHKNKENDNYIDSSWNNFQDALLEALSVLENENATQVEVDHALQALSEAVAGLKEKEVPQKTAAEVAAEITSIQSPAKGATRLVLPSVGAGFSLEIYSSSDPNVIALDGTITPQSGDTSVVLVLEVTRQSDGSKALTAAITVVLSFEGEDPVEDADKSKLEAMYNQYKDKDKDNYTDSSWSNFQDALIKALNVLEDADATQVEVDHALQALSEAVAGLKQNETPQKTAAEVAGEIKSITAPARNVKKLTLPQVPEGFTIAIKSSSNEIVALDGRIQPPTKSTEVTLILEVTRIFDDTKATTGEITVMIPAKKSSSSGSSGSSGGSSQPSTEKEEEVEETVEETEKEEVTEETEEETVPQPKVTFNDVVENHWASSNIQMLVEKNIFAGYPDGTFKPDNKINRAEFMAAICRMLGLEPVNGQSVFKDVNSDAWYSGYANALYEADIMKGYEDGTFRPTQEITREEAFVILYRTMKDQLEISNTDNGFSDHDHISNWAKEAVDALSNARVVNGYEDGTIRPKNGITRAETATILSSFLE